MTAEEIQFHHIGEQIPNAHPGKIFGKPAFKVNGKIVMCFYRNSMVFKLRGAFHKKALELPNACLFDPSGKKRPMREWVQVPKEHCSIWPVLAESAADYANQI